MVVVLIIAILIAIAIPTFLGARTRAQDRAAQASLRNALVAAKSIYTDKQDYAQAIKTAGTCFYIKDDLSTGTTYASGSTCTATAAASATFTSKW